MIRISIFFLVFFISHPILTWGQDEISFSCYNLDTISWNIKATECTNLTIDSFQIFSRPDQTSEFILLTSGTDPSVRGYRHESLKSDEALLVHYFVQCPEPRLLQSDTLSLSSLREAVEMDSVRVLDNGDVELSWVEKPIEGIRYVVNAAVGGSSQVLASGLEHDTYTDTRGLAADNIEYYSISAALGCGYTFPEPDSFYHTSFLRAQTSECGGEIHFDFTPFSYWNEGTISSTLFVLQNGNLIDSMDLSVASESFMYSDLINESMYTFYVRETGSAQGGRIAYSNPITIYTDFYEPIKWIVIDDLSFDEDNRLSIAWTTNEHLPKTSFQLYSDLDSLSVPMADLLHLSGNFNYGYDLSSHRDATTYKITLRDSCGNTVQSLDKTPLITNGQLTSDNHLNIQWRDIKDEEWTVNSYDIYFLTNGAYSLLGSVSGSSMSYQYAFGESQIIDSLCYYIEARGELKFGDTDSTAELRVRSNKVCLFGETIVELPNAHSSHQSPYKPIIVPKSNLASYVFRIYDRYGNLVFETHDPEEGWDGQYQGKSGFSDVFVVQVEMVNTQGESIEKTGSLIVFQ